MAANVVLSFNQVTFRTGLLFSLGGTRIHYRKHCGGKVTVVSTPFGTRVGHAWKKLYHGNDHKSANRVGIAVFSSGRLSLKRRQQRLGGEHVRSSDSAGFGKFGFHQLHLANGQRGPKRKFLGKLLNGKPITPSHTPSSSRNGIELRITDEDRRFFSDFEMFADALNHRFEPNEPWRLQERPDGELTGREEPEYGRRYEIFYNEYSVGNLQIFASHHYGPADPQVGTEIELQYARLLPFGEINRFISAIANFTASGNAEEAQRVKNAIHETMLNELWQHEFDPDLDSRNSGGSIELRFDGSAAAFLRTSTNRKDHSI